MFLKIFSLILILFSITVQAQTIHVEYGYNTFSLEIRDTEIKYQKKDYKDFVKKRDCSKNLFNSFSKKINALFSSTPQNAKNSKDFLVKYRFNDKTGQLLPTSSFAKRILTLSQEFETFRLATEFRCEEEQKQLKK